MVEGYEIHMGISNGEGLSRPVVKLAASNDGAISEDNQVLGSYLHGLFDHPEACRALLQWAGLKQAGSIDYHTIKEQELDRLADTLEQHLDIEKLLTLVD